VIGAALGWLALAGAAVLVMAMGALAPTATDPCESNPTGLLCRLGGAALPVMMGLIGAPTIAIGTLVGAVLVARSHAGPPLAAVPWIGLGAEAALFGAMFGAIALITR
jgi:hypothetical protein